MGPIIARSIAKTAALTFVMVGAASAQDAGGTLMTISVSERLSYTDNAGFDASGAEALQSVTNLGFSLSSQTRRERVAFTTGTGLSYSSDTGEFTVTNPTLRLEYGRESKDAAITANVIYRQADIASFVQDAEDVDSNFVVLDTGSRTDARAGLGFEFGRTAPFGGAFNINHSQRTYQDTTDPDLLDARTTSANGRLSFRIDDRITARLTAGLTLLDVDGGNDRTTTTLGTGVALQVNPRLTMDASLNYNKVEVDDGTTVTTTDGLGATISAVQTVPDGTYSASLSSGIDQNGRRTSARIARQQELKNGALQYSLGVSTREGGGLDPLYGVSFAQELPRGASWNVSLNQAFDTSSDGREALNSNFTIGYATPLNRTASLQANASYRDSNVLNRTDEDANRLDVSVSLRQALAQEWGLVGGYTHSVAESDTATRRSSNNVFVGVQKDFSWRP